MSGPFSFGMDHQAEGRALGAASSSPYPRKTAPVFFVTSATTLAATASISTSVRVFSRGCKVTATPTDFLPSGMPTPS